MGIVDKIKALFKIKAFIDWFKTESKKEVRTMEGNKPSWKTGEFWFAAASQLIPLVLFMWQYLPEKMTLMLMASGGTLAVAIIVSRTIIKATPSKEDDKWYNRIVTLIKPILDKINVKAEPIE